MSLVTFPRPPLNRNGCPNLKTRYGEKTPEEFSQLDMRWRPAKSAKNPNAKEIRGIETPNYFANATMYRWNLAISSFRDCCE